MLLVGVSYISTSNVCFWRRSSSLVEVVYITVLRLKQDLAVKKCCIAFSIKKSMRRLFQLLFCCQSKSVKAVLHCFQFQTALTEALLFKLVHKILSLCRAWLLAAHTARDKTILLFCICHTSLINQRSFYGIVYFHWVSQTTTTNAFYHCPDIFYFSANNIVLCMFCKCCVSHIYICTYCEIDAICCVLC